MLNITIVVNGEPIDVCINQSQGINQGKPKVEYDLPNSFELPRKGFYAKTLNPVQAFSLFKFLKELNVIGNYSEASLLKFIEIATGQKMEKPPYIDIENLQKLKSTLHELESQIDVEISKNRINLNNND